MSTSAPKSLPLTHDPTAYAETLPPRYRALYLRATQGHRPSARKAVCIECMGWAEGAVKSIRLCPCVACPNHAVRPYQDPTEKADRQRAKGESEGGERRTVTSRAADHSRIERLKKAKEARKHKGGGMGEGGWSSLGVAGLLSVVVLLLGIFGIIYRHQDSPADRCPPVSSPTGRLLCYSGGTLVYQTSTYRNGGILCSSSGV